jgi:hypothetical protein
VFRVRAARVTWQERGRTGGIVRPHGRPGTLEEEDSREEKSVEMGSAPGGVL